LHKIKSARVLQNKIATSIHTLHKIKSAMVLQNKIVKPIHFNLFIHEIGVSRCAGGRAAVAAEEAGSSGVDGGEETGTSNVDGGGGDRRSRERRSRESSRGGGQLEWHQCWWRRLARAASMATEETSGVESDRLERERWGFDCFGMKSETTRGGLIFIGSKISEAILNQNHC
jgi:hypothetical protein